MSDLDKTLNIPPTLQSRTDKADFRKLPVELQQKVAAKEVSLNAAAIQASYEKAKAKERQEATQAKPGEGKVGQGNISLTEPMQSRDAIGARVGVGRIRKGEGEGTTRN